MARVKQTRGKKRVRKNIAKGVVYALTAIILFVVVKIILSIVVSLIDGIAKLPILKQFNEVGGMAYGIVRGLLIICIAVLLMGVYTKIKPESTLNTKIQASFITKILYENICAGKCGHTMSI